MPTGRAVKTPLGWRRRFEAAPDPASKIGPGQQCNFGYFRLRRKLRAPEGPVAAVRVA